MYRAALRSASRPVGSGFRSNVVRAVPRRFASTTTPVDKPRSWKSSALRWSVAVAGVYYYNTSSVFADDVSSHIEPVPTPYGDSDLPTVEALIEKKKEESSKKPPRSTEKKGEAPKDSETEAAPAQNATFEGSPEALEEEAGQEGAFNPETGEINWDCPCLGGMAHGPCGEEFRTAFSCFVHSEEDPKGMDCIDKFQGMQECFRKYPEIYGAELEDEAEDADEANELVPEHIEVAPAKVIATAEETEFQQLREDHPVAPQAESVSETANLPGVKTVGSAVPNKWQNATDANEETQRDEKDKQ